MDNISDGNISADIPSICIAHMTESHYLSLRPKHWRTSLGHHPVKRNPKCRKRMVYNVYHLDNIVKLLTDLRYIYCIEDNHQLPSGKGNYIVESVGHHAMRMEPLVDKVKSLYPSMEIYFQLTDLEAEKTPAALTKYITPKDTHVLASASIASKSDLIIEEVTKHDANLFRLIPVKARVWKGQTQLCSDGKTYLKSSNTLHHVDSPTQAMANVEVLAFQSVWPDCAKEWVGRYCTSRILSATDRQEIMKLGCHVITAVSQDSLNDVLDVHVEKEMAKDETLWCYSFAVAERHLCIEVLTHHQRQAFLVFKLLVDKAVSDHPIPSALVKSVFYYGCESIPKDDWQRQPGMCILIMLQRLMYGLKIEYIPHYFIAGHNLLARIPSSTLKTCTQEVKSIKDHLLMHLFFIMDSNGIFETELGTYFDDIFEDIVGYSSHRNILQTIQATSNQATITLLENLITRNEYQKARTLIEDFREKMIHYMGEQITLLKALSLITIGLTWESLWCMALYIDIQKGTNLTKDICEYFRVQTVHISEVFGPKLPACISNKPIPEFMAIENGDLIAANMFLTVCNQSNLSGYMAPALSFYIGRYSELANGLVLEFECRCHRSRSCNQYAQTVYLSKLYKSLLDLYKDQDQVEEFRPWMTTFVLLVQSLQTPSRYKWLSDAWELLGEKEEADNALKQSIEPKPLNIFRELMKALPAAE